MADEQNYRPFIGKRCIIQGTRENLDAKLEGVYYSQGREAPQLFVVWFDGVGKRHSDWFEPSEIILPRG